MSNILSALPQYSLPAGYINGFNLTKIDDRKINISPGVCIDSTNSNNIVSLEDLNINFDDVGLGGIDVGTSIVNTLWNIYVINDPTGNNPVGVVASLNPFVPQLPAGIVSTNYSQYRRIGVIRINGASIVVKPYQSGTGNYRRYNLDGIFTILANGTATSYSTVSCNFCAPAITGWIYAQVFFTTSNPLDTFQIKPTGAGFAPISLNQSRESIQIPVVYIPGNDNASFDYKITLNSAPGASLTINLVGYDDYL